MVLYTVVSVYTIEFLVEKCRCQGLEIAEGKLWRARERERSLGAHGKFNGIDIDIQDQLFWRMVS